MNKALIYCILLSVFGAFEISLCEAQTDMRRYKFYTVTEADGLLSDQIWCIAKDGKGFIWAGSSLGLCRYDGYIFKQYTHNATDPDGLRGTNITDLTEDTGGNLWIATELGMNFYSIKKESFTHYPLRDNGQLFNDYQADKIIYTSTGGVYYHSSLGKLYKFFPREKEFRPVLEKLLTDKQIRYCFKDLNDNFILVSEIQRKIYRVDTTGRIKQVFKDFTFGNDPCTAMYTFLDYGNGSEYYGSDNGLFEYNPETGKISQVKELFGTKLSVKVKTLYKDTKGNIWMGTNANNLYLIDMTAKKVTCFEASSETLSQRLINSTTVTSIIETDNGLMWFGTWRGLSYTEIDAPESFKTVQYPEDKNILTQNIITSFCEVSDNIIAVGSDGGGISFWDQKKNQCEIRFTDRYVPDNRLMSSPSIFAIRKDNNGNLYCGGYSNPLLRITKNLNIETGSCYNPDDSSCLASSFIRDILIDSKERIWVLTNGGGLHRYYPQTGKFERIRKDKNNNSPCSIYGICLCEGPSGEIFIGTYQGLTVYYPEQNLFKNYSSNHSEHSFPSHNWIFGILVDSKKRVWTLGPAGINRFDISTETFSTFSNDETMQSSACYSGVEDNSCYIWISTAKGLIKFSPDYGRTIRTYSTSEGLSGGNFIPGAAYKDSKGNIYFGSNEGIVFFNPEKIKEKKNIPAPTITDISVQHKSIPIAKLTGDKNVITLTPEQNTISIQFASLGYVNAADYRYACKLDGYDNDWNNVGQRREIDFTNLNPGEYCFKVKVMNGNGSWSKDTTELKIVVLPPWYKTVWAGFMFAFWIIVIIFTVYRLRVDVLKKQKKVLEDTVRQRTLDLVKINGELESQKEEIFQQREEILAQRDELYEKNNALEESKTAIEKSYDNLSLLSILSRKISSSFDIDFICKTIYESDAVNLKECGFCIAVCNEKVNMLEFSSYMEHGESRLPNEEKLTHITDPFTARCIGERREILVDINNEEYKIPFILSGRGYKYFIRIPMLNGSNVEGVMIINCFENIIGKNEMAGFKMLAANTAVAIDKARAYAQIKSKNVAINGSLSYAKTIQEALLGKAELLSPYFESAVIYRSKDIVSGDFYWIYEIKNASDITEHIFVATIDCTGHGVAGAFMTIMSNTVLNEIVGSAHIIEPAHILDMLSAEIFHLLKQENGVNKDGMDMTLLRFDLENNKIFRVTYSGAKNPPLIKKKTDNRYTILMADILSIAGGIKRNLVDYKFTKRTIAVSSGDIFYTSTDGLYDQNNKERKRFGRSNFINIITNCADLPMEIQKQTIEKAIDNHSQGTEQRDDITVVGLKIK